MYELEVKVTNIVKILTKDLKIGSNNLNTIQINFTLPDEFSGLTVLAVFTNSEEKSYKKTVTDNKCLIPFEALKEGKVILGVYAYSGDELIYSPIATTFIVEKGSYVANSEDETTFTPSDFDLWLEQANEMYLKITELTAGLDSKVQEVEEKLENGEFTPVKGVDYWTESDKTEIITDVTDKIKPELQSINTKIDTINNDIIDIDSDIHNINTELGNKLNENNANKFINNIEYNTKTATFTFTAYDNTQIKVDLPIESTVQDGGYDKETHELYLILVSGQEIRIPVTDLVDDYTGEETVTIQVLVSSDNKITANIKGGSISENLLDENVKAKLNKVVDLTPYYTKIEVNGLLENKVDKIEGMGLSQENFTTALKEKIGSLSIELQQGSIKNVTYNAETGVISFIKNDNSKIDIDLPLELLVESGIYDEGNKQIVLTLANGNVINIPLSDLLDDLYTKSEVDEMVAKLENENQYQNQIIDQFSKEFEEGTAEGETIHITDSGELPMVLEPHGNLKQEVIEAVEGNTVSGESISVSDVDTTKEFSLEYQGNSKQEKREGYNLGLYDVDTQTVNGVTFTHNKNGSMNINGTSNDNYITFVLNTTPVTLEAGTYTFAYVQDVATSGDIHFNIRNTLGTTLMVTYLNANIGLWKVKELVLEETTEINYVYYVSKNLTVNNQNFKFMVLKGTYTTENLPEFEIYGETPSIEIPSEIENVKGYNAINNIAQSTTNNGITFTVNEDKSITLNGTATAQAFICLTNSTNNINSYENKVLTLKDKYYANPLGNNNLLYGIRDTNGTYKTLATSIGQDIGLIYINVVQGATFNNYTIYPMLINGSSEAKPYAPYGSVPFTLQNKNLFDKNKAVEGRIDASVSSLAFGNIIASTATNTSDFIPVKKGDKLILTFDYETLLSENTRNYLLYDEGKKPLKNYADLIYGVTGKKTIFNIDVNGFFRFSYDKNCYNIQIEKNDIETNYVEHQEQNYNLHIGDLEFNGIGNVRDSLLVELDDYFAETKTVKKLYHKKLFDKLDDFTGLLKELTGTGEITRAKVNIDSNFAFSHLYENPGLSNILKTVNNEATYSNVEGFTVNVSDTYSTLYMYIDEYKSLSAEEYIAKLNEVGAYFILPLKEPELIDLTDDYPELVDDIETIINNAELYEGTTNIDTTSNLVIELDYNYITPSPSIIRPSEIHYVEGDNDILIEEGAEIAEPQSQNLSLTLPEEIKLYGKEDGFVYLTDGSDGKGWYVYNEWGEYTFTGNENLIDETTRPIDDTKLLYMASSIFKNTSNEVIIGAKCNYFKEDTPNNIWYNNIIAFSININRTIHFRTTMSLTEFKTWSEEKNTEGNPLKVVGKLTNPTYTKITDSTLISQLESLKKVFSYYPVTNIDSIPENAPIYFNVEYLKSNKIILQTIQEQIEDIKQQISNN